MRLSRGVLVSSQVFPGGAEHPAGTLDDQRTQRKSTCERSEFVEKQGGVVE